MPLNAAILGRGYGPSTFAVEREQVDKFRNATLDTSPEASRSESVPAAFAFLPCWPIIQKALADPELGSEPGQVIHGEEIMEFERELRVGDLLTTTGEVTRIEPKGRNEVYVLTLESRDARSGDLLVRQDNVCISIGSGPDTAGPRSEQRSGDQSEEPPAPTRTVVTDLPKDINRLYAAASGDQSAVHLDDDAATALGFPGVIVHGMCSLAVALHGALDRGTELAPQAVKRLQVRFSSPIQPGQRMTSHYWDRESGCKFEAVAPNGRRVLSNGYVAFGSDAGRGAKNDG